MLTNKYDRTNTKHRHIPNKTRQLSKIYTAAGHQKRVLFNQEDSAVDIKTRSRHGSLLPLSSKRGNLLGIQSSSLNTFTTAQVTKNNKTKTVDWLAAEITWWEQMSPKWKHWSTVCSLPPQSKLSKAENSKSLTRKLKKFGKPHGNWWKALQPTKPLRKHKPLSTGWN